LDVAFISQELLDIVNGLTIDLVDVGSISLRSPT
jgi:hypothetical protein